MMKDLSKIKWAAIQPLTGGMYIGAEEAIGHPAEYILSYPGVGEAECDKDNKIKTAGNEYNLMTYLKKHDRNPNYACFNRKMFQNDNDMNPEIIESPWTKDLSFFKNIDNLRGMDLIVAVPVCAGLSSATRASQETCDERNCNMVWIAKYALNVLKPQCYVFENAPRMMSTAGDNVRMQCEDIARQAGYSIVYYRTDTMYHDNAQKRSRTFIMFFKGEHAPEVGFDRREVDVLDYLARIPKDATQQVCIDWLPFNNDFVKYAVEKLGDDAFSKFNVVTKWIAYNNLYDDFKAWLKQHPEHHPSTEKFIDHVFDKMSQGGGWYDMSCYRSHDNKTHAVIFKTMKAELHPTENRLFTIREQLHLMGMPHDFELQGDINKEYPKIGQNVPVKTAKFIVEEMLKHMNDNETETPRIRYFSNIKQQELVYVP